MIGIRQCESKLAAGHDFVGEIIGLSLALICGAVGTIVHGSNIDTEPAMRSFTFAFMGVNLSIGWKIWSGMGINWLDFLPVLAVIVIFGFVLGLLLSEGDVQKETKERWRREAEAAQAKSVKAVGNDQGSEKMPANSNKQG